MTDAIDRCVLISAEFERRKWLGLPAPSLAEIDALLGRVTTRGAMIATREPGPQLPATGGREAEPMPPVLRFNDRGDACAVVMVFNGTEYRAVLDLDGRGMVRAGDVAAMLERLAGEIRAEGARV